LLYMQFEVLFVSLRARAPSLLLALLLVLMTASTQHIGGRVQWCGHREAARQDVVEPRCSLRHRRGRALLACPPLLQKTNLAAAAAAAAALTPHADQEGLRHCSIPKFQLLLHGP
jgi:hypothetical protein